MQKTHTLDLLAAVSLIVLAMWFLFTNSIVVAVVWSFLTVLYLVIIVTAAAIKYERQK